MCTAGADRLAGVWEPAGGDTPRKAAVRRAFLATSRGYAATSFDSVAHILDRYAGAWSRMYEDACKATHLRGDQSAATLDLRMSCLQDRLGRLRALVDVFAQADSAVVENAPAAAGALPPLARCADAAMLRTVMPAPDDPAARARVEMLRRDLARVEAMADAGQCASAVQVGRKLVGEARAVAYQPLEAEALNALARAGSDCLEPAQAVQLYKEALRAAVASRHDEAAVTAAVLMAIIMADRLHAVHEARDWLELGRAILRPISASHPVLEAWALNADGLVSGREGDHQAALAKFQRALALQQQTLGDDHLEVARSLGNVGSALEDLDRVEESVTYFDRARRLAVKLLGPDHPQVAEYLVERGEALNALHLYQEALEDNHHAVAIWQAAGASRFQLACGLTGLAESLMGLQRPRDAVTYLEEALRAHQDNKTPFYPATRFALARALWPAGDQRPRAVALAAEAKSEYERTGADASRTAEVATWLRSHAVR
jgi:tetratricopeptide (TPR) repeat protein